MKSMVGGVPYTVGRGWVPRQPKPPGERQVARCPRTGGRSQAYDDQVGGGDGAGVGFRGGSPVMASHRLTPASAFARSG